MKITKSKKIKNHNIIRTNNNSLSIRKTMIHNKRKNLINKNKNL